MPKPRLFKTNTHKSPPKCRLGLCKYYPEVDLCKTVTGKRLPPSLHPELVGLQDLSDNHHQSFSVAVSLLGWEALQSTCSFYLNAKPPSLIRVLICNKEESELKYFYLPLFNLCKARLGEKLHVFLTRVRSPTDTRSSPFHNAALLSLFQPI